MAAGVVSETLHSSRSEAYSTARSGRFEGAAPQGDEREGCYGRSCAAKRKDGAGRDNYCELDSVEVMFTKLWAGLFGMGAAPTPQAPAVDPATAQRMGAGQGLGYEKLEPEATELSTASSEAGDTSRGLAPARRSSSRRRTEGKKPTLQGKELQNARVIDPNCPRMKMDSGLSEMAEGWASFAGGFEHVKKAPAPVRFID
eukprot:TRINITY_DN48934_c0_g1_i1.p2 TRINITY_DN48934_c0_g1~~TRINITY_DN48934_c0_g1_i1.p2  ORF type:complete len:200 (+),score=42.79 TRINITY_DN48934_c0_g1_i1:86-685(+)